MATLRNVDKRPHPGFVKAYGHNGYFTSLKMIVHFYNTRDVLPRCQPHNVNEGATCWPAPELTDNVNTSRVGHLGLSDAEEDAIVSFMQTLTDGFMTVTRSSNSQTLQRSTFRLDLDQFGRPIAP